MPRGASSRRRDGGRSPWANLWTNPRRTFVVLAACEPRSPKFAGGGLDHRALIAATSGVPAPSSLTTVLDTEVRVARCQPGPANRQVPCARDFQVVRPTTTQYSVLLAHATTRSAPTPPAFQALASQLPPT